MLYGTTASGSTIALFEAAALSVAGVPVTIGVTGAGPGASGPICLAEILPSPVGTLNPGRAGRASRPAAASRAGGVWQGSPGPPRPVITGRGTGRLPKPGVAGAGGEKFAGTGRVTIPPLAVSGSVMVAEDAGFITVPAMAVTAAGVVSALGSGAVVVPKPTLSAGGGLVFTGAAAMSLPGLSLKGLGGQTFTGTGGTLLPKPAVAGAVIVHNYVGRGIVTLPKPAVAGTGLEIITGHGAMAVRKPTLSGVIGEQPRGSGGVILPKPSVAGSGTRRWDYSEVWSAPDKLKITGGTMR